MDPIGTITRYYPFLDKKTVYVLKEVLLRSKDMKQFVHNLADEVISRNQSSELILLAALFAWRTSEATHRNRISEKCGSEIIAKPWMIPSWISKDGRLESTKNHVVEAIQKAFGTNPEDWILLHLHIRKAYAFAAVHEGAEALVAARELVRKNQDLECFEADIDYLEAYMIRNEDDKSAACELCQSALNKARKYGDIHREVRILTLLAGWEDDKDIHKAMDTINEAYSLTKKLGLSDMMVAILARMSGIAHTMGEYDLAIKCLHEILEYDRPELSTPSHAPLDLSSIYCDIEDGKQALEWAKLWDDVGDSCGPPGLPGHGCPYYVKARALLLLDRHDEALEQINILHDIALRSGSESFLSSYYYTSGMYEVSIGNLDAGVESIKRSLESCERGKRQVGINRCLLDLTRIEIDMFVLGDNEIDPGDSGPWMIRLEREASEKKLHGILMQHSILKAEFQEKNMQIDAARDTLRNALEICNLPSVSTQQNWILTRLEGLDTIRPH